MRIPRFICATPAQATCMLCRIAQHNKVGEFLAWLHSALFTRAIQCRSPSKMDIFIFTELRYGSSERDPCQTGSTPNGYGPLARLSPEVKAAGHDSCNSAEQRTSSVLAGSFRLPQHHRLLPNSPRCRVGPHLVCAHINQRHAGIPWALVVRAAKDRKRNREGLVVDQAREQ